MSASWVVRDPASECEFEFRSLLVDSVGGWTAGASRLTELILELAAAAMGVNATAVANSVDAACAGCLLIVSIVFLARLIGGQRVSHMTKQKWFHLNIIAAAAGTRSSAGPGEFVLREERRCCV